MNRIVKVFSLIAAFVAAGMIGASAFEEEIRAGEVVPSVGEVAIDESNFPDSNFRDYVKQFDTDKNGYFSSDEIENVYSIDCVDKSISSLKGIEFFYELKELQCSDNKIEVLDVSKNDKLRVLFCRNNLLETLSVDNHSNLEALACDGNALKTLDVRKCENLLDLECANNQLESLHTANKKLETILCYQNKLTSIDVSEDSNLSCFWCYDNQITELNVSNNKKLASFYCRYNLLEKLDLSNNSELTNLDCNNNQLVQLILGKKPNLREITCYDNHLKELDVSSYLVLETLLCQNNELTKMDVRNNTELRELDCSFNDLRQLDVSSNRKLVSLKCDATKLTSLDVSMLKDLEVLFCSYNQLTKVDVGHCPNLKSLWLSNNQISNLDISKNTKLTDLNCMHNQISRIDVSTHPYLLDLMCGVNNISTLDVSNNPELLMLDCGGNQISSLDLKNNPKIIYLACDNNQISNLDLSNNLQIGILAIETNKIKTIDLRKHDVLFDRVLHADEWKEEQWYYAAINMEILYYGSRGYLLTSGTFIYDKSTEVLFKDNSILPKPTPSVTPVPGQPIPAPPTGSIADFVERLYTVALGRASEEGGKKYWVDEITNGNKTGADCGLFFLTSEEFNNRGLSIDSFVETLYETFFGRASEPDGKAYWVGQLKSGAKSRADVIWGFIDSKEWCNICADYGVKSGAPTAKAEHASQNAIDFARRLYTCCLGREPEEGGLKYWSLALTNLEQTGCSAAKEFFTSTEFVNLKLGNEEYVRRLYTTFMGRDPETSEIAYWVGEIKAGRQTKESVMAFFGQSPEFTNICKKYGIDRGTI